MFCNRQYLIQRKSEAPTAQRPTGRRIVAGRISCKTVSNAVRSARLYCSCVRYRAGKGHTTEQRERQMLCEKLNSWTYHSTKHATLTASKSKVCRRLVGSSHKLRRCVARCWLHFADLRVFRLARMYQRAGWVIACMLGVLSLLLLPKFYVAGPSLLLRGSTPQRPLSASPSASNSQQWQRTASSIEGRSASGDFSGVGAVGMTGQNGECQMILDSRGNPLNDLSGPALPLGIAVTGEVSNGGYEYYTVRKRYRMLQIKCMSAQLTVIRTDRAYKYRVYPWYSRSLCSTRY